MSGLKKNIHKPTLLLNKQRAMQNIVAMAEKAQKSHTEFRPHFKTHQSAAIGKWFQDVGVTKITVSSLDMAEYLSEYGWADITVAIPTNIRQIDLINDLAGRIKLNLVIESVSTIEFLSQNLNSTVDIWLKIDVGYHRTGITWHDSPRILRIVNATHSAGNLILAGILTHAGHSYQARTPDDIADIFFKTAERMSSVQSMLDKNQHHVAISIGDTPGCSVVDEFKGIEEVRPGNFIFYDLHQLELGSCRENDIAIAVACPIIAKDESRKQLVIYGGAIHLSKESLNGNNGHSIYGRICKFEELGWSRMFGRSYISELSQEHGVIQAEPELFDTVQIGELLAILPVHSCLTANLLGQYLTLEGEVISMFHYQQ